MGRRSGPHLTAEALSEAGLVAGSKFSLQIEDDGPGVPAGETRGNIWAWGARRRNDTGQVVLGFFIVRDIATHYDDDVALGTVLSGGLQAAVPLPGAILAKTS